jgi:hypothetical protein
MDTAGTNSAATLAFERIEVRRAPGISPGYTIGDLSPDINIVFGPNASGKSTTARAIQALLWPHPTLLRRHELAAGFVLGGDRWTVEAGPGRVRRSRNGEPADPPLLAPIDDRARYTLGLPDLLASENQPLAQAVFRESTGGFDLEAIRRDRGLGASVPARLEAARDVETAQLRVRDTERVTSDITAQQRQLTTIRDRERRAREAHSNAENFRRALRYARARRELERAGSVLHRFPDAMQRLAGNEQDELARLQTRRDALEDRRIMLTEALERANADRKRTGLVGTEISESLIRTLRGHVTQIERLDHDVTRLQRDLQGVIAQRDSHRKRLAADLSEQQLARLDTDGLRELATLSHDYAELRVKRQARDELERWLGTAEVPAPEHIEETQQGITLLVDRLRTPSADELDHLLARTRVAAVVGGGLVIATAIWLGIFVETAWYLLAVPGLLILLFIWRYATPRSAVEAARLEHRYSQTNLPQPVSWDASGVRQTLAALQHKLHDQLLAQEKASRWQDLESHRAELANQEMEVNARRDQIVARYGVAPDLGEQSLRLLAENLSRWQDADGRVRSLQGNLNAIGQERRNIETLLRDHLSRFGYASGTFAANIDELAERLGEYSEASSRATVGSQELNSQVLPEIQRLDEARAAIFGRLDLADNDMRGLEALYAQRDAWEAASAEHSEREREAREADEALALAPELKQADPETIQRQLEAAETAATDLEPAMQEISEIRTRIGDAKRRRDQEEALLRRDNALQRLRDERASVERSLAGDTLLTFIREQTRDAALPIVFHRARELFTIITRGRYELQFDEGPPPAFTARDTSSGHTLGLDQLSSGTRVQLLMAIRLAFVENVERGPKLPILLDETLGNSDELRAGAIIDAAIEICRNGRQVFYFTAQGDEVARWKSRLQQIPEEERPRSAIVDLAEVRQDAGIERLPIQQMGPAAGHLPVPTPAGRTRIEYAAALRVPGIDPWAETLGGVHLWHAVTDTDALHNLVNQDLRTWGQLSGLAESGSRSTLAVMGIENVTWKRAAARMRVLQAAREAWRIGRVRPLTNGDLAESGEIPPAVLPAVADSLSEANGDAEALIRLLQDRGVEGLDAGAIDRLESWLLDHGFITTATSLGRDEIRLRVLSDASGDLEVGSVTIKDVDELLDQLPGV